MLRRNLQSDFVGGAYVFPGGGVDDHDRLRRSRSRCARGAPTPRPPASSGVDAGGLAFWVAAIRESFEEAGVLLAYDGPDLIRFDDPDRAARFVAHRAEVDQGRAG